MSGCPTGSIFPTIPFFIYIHLPLHLSLFFELIIVLVSIFFFNTVAQTTIGDAYHSSFGRSPACPQLSTIKKIVSSTPIHNYHHGLRFKKNNNTALDGCASFYTKSCKHICILINKNKKAHISTINKFFSDIFF